MTEAELDQWVKIMGFVFVGWSIPVVLYLIWVAFQDWQFRRIDWAWERDRARDRPAPHDGSETLPAADVTDPAVADQIRALGVPCRRCGAANVMTELEDGSLELCCPFWRPGREPADSL